MPRQSRVEYPGAIHHVMDRGDRREGIFLGRLGWSESDLATRRTSDLAKLAIAARLRKETTLAIKSIAAKVHLGTSQSADNRFHAWMKAQPDAAPPQPVLGL